MIRTPVVGDLLVRLWMLLSIHAYHFDIIMLHTAFHLLYCIDLRTDR